MARILVINSDFHYRARMEKVIEQLGHEAVVIGNKDLNILYYTFAEQAIRDVMAGELDCDVILMSPLSTSELSPEQNDIHFLARMLQTTKNDRGIKLICAHTGNLLTADKDQYDESIRHGELGRWVWEFKRELGEVLERLGIVRRETEEVICA